MSEKLYQIVKVVRTPRSNNSPSKRLLVFEGPNYHEEVSFLRGYSSVIFNEELYDWHGHKIDISWPHMQSNTPKILAYYPKPFDGQHPYSDFFIAIDENGLFTKVFLSNKEFFVSSRLQHHRIMENRNQILNLKKTYVEPTHEWYKADELIYDVSSSNDGTKIIAHTLLPDQNGNSRIAADIETLRITNKSEKLYWYYDPES